MGQQFDDEQDDTEYGNIPTLSQAEEFFYEWAGWSWVAETETEEDGRRRGARELAEAEQWSRRENVTYEWAPDLDCDSRDREFESAVAYDADGQVIGSLGCIEGACTECRRVVNAELALQAMRDAAS